MYAYLASRTGSRADAEDLTAQVFAKVVENLSRYDKSRGSPRAWVLAMARNVLVDHLRARREHTSLSDVEGVLADARTIPAEGADDERLDRVRAALQRYGPDVREMFALRFGDGLRYREIAVVMGSSEAAIKQRFSRVLRELRQRARRGELDEDVVHAH